MSPKEEESERLSELRSTVSHARKRIDGEYIFMMYGNKFREIDEIHERTLDLLSEYEVLLDSLLN